MDLSLNSSSSLLNFWNYKLKFGILCGAISISSSAGAIATISNKDLIAGQITEIISPIKTSLSTIYTSIYTGAGAIVGTYKGWSNSVSNRSDLYEWINKQSFRNISSGFVLIKEQWRLYADSFKTYVSSFWESKENLKNMNFDFLKKLLMYSFEYYAPFKNLFSVFWKSALTMIRHLLDPKRSSDDKEIQQAISMWNAFRKLIFSNQITNLFKSFARITIENSRIVRGLNADQLLQILMFAFNNTDKFLERIKLLSESNPSNLEGKWGNYRDGSQLIDDLLNITVFDYLFGAAENFALKITQCSKDAEDCKRERILKDTAELFGRTTADMFFGFLKQT